MNVLRVKGISGLKDIQLSRLKGFWGLVSLCLTVYVQAQTEPVKLDSVVLSPRGIARLSVLDSLESRGDENLGDVLRENSTVFVKSRSGNALSSISIRGGTPEQSAVYWNGLSIQNTLNGNVDMSLLPSFAFDEIEINAYQSSNSGSGAIAGSVGLRNSKIDTSNSLNTQVGFGSYGQASGALRWISSGKRSMQSVTVFGAQAENNYFLANEGHLRLDHAGFVNFGILYHQRIELKKSNPINIRGWFQKTEREIPATLVEGSSQKYQQDDALRIQTDWSHQFNKTELKLNAGFFVEGLDYQDSASKIFTSYTFTNSSLLAHVVHSINTKVKLGFDLEARNYAGLADTFYERNRTEISQAIHGRYRDKKNSVQASIRSVQFTDNADLPVLFSLKYGRSLFPHLKLITSWSTNYRMPTFNNLYWTPGGNPDLESESSNNVELNLIYKRQKGELRFGVFDNRINNQIRWLPGGKGYFEAQQVVGETQWNRGVELSGHVYIRRSKFYLNVAYVRSTPISDNLFGGLQQTITPNLTGNTGYRFTYKKWRFGYSYWAVSRRFVDVENTEYLPAVFVHDLTVKRTIRAFDLSLTISNVGNQFYTLFPYVPNMPRSINFQISHQLRKNKTQ